MATTQSETKNEAVARHPNEVEAPHPADFSKDYPYGLSDGQPNDETVNGRVCAYCFRLLPQPQRVCVYYREHVEQNKDCPLRTLTRKDLINSVKNDITPFKAEEVTLSYPRLTTIPVKEVEKRLQVFLPKPCRRLTDDPMEAMNRLMVANVLLVNEAYSLGVGHAMTHTCTLSVKNRLTDKTSVYVANKRTRKDAKRECVRLWLMDSLDNDRKLLDQAYVDVQAFTEPSERDLIRHSLVPGLLSGVEKMFRGAGSTTLPPTNLDQPVIPKNHDIITLQPVPQLSLGNQPLALDSLRLDKQTRTPAIIDDNNELSKEAICSVEGLLNPFKVNINTKNGEILWTMPISPIQGCSTATGTTSNYWNGMLPGYPNTTVPLTYLTPLSNLGQHFCFYSGNMILTFYIGAAMPHSWRFRVSRIPDVDTTQEIDALIEEISVGSFPHVDFAIEESHEVSYVVENITPFKQNQIFFRDVLDPYRDQWSNTTGSGVAHPNPLKLSPWTYGWIVVTALTPLRSTGVTADEINVSVTLKAAPGFDYAVPISSQAILTDKSQSDRRRRANLVRHAGDESLSSADAGGVDQLGVNQAGDTAVTGAREESQTTTIKLPKAPKIQAQSGVKNVDRDLTDRFIQFAEVEVTSSMSFGEIFRTYDLTSDILKIAYNTPNGLLFKQNAFARPNLTILIKINSPQMNGGDFVAGVRYYTTGFQTGASTNIKHTAYLIQTPHAKGNFASANDILISIPYQSYMDFIPTTNNRIGSPQYYATLMLGILNPLALGEGCDNPVITLYAGFSAESEQTVFLGQRDFYDYMTPTRRDALIRHSLTQGVVQVDERTESQELIPTVVTSSTPALESVNGESFALKDYLRRPQLFFDAHFTSLESPTDPFPNAAGTGKVFQLPYANDLGTPALFITIPNKYSDCGWRGFYGAPGDRSGAQGNNPADYISTSQQPCTLLEHLAEAYRFGRGPLKYNVQWGFNHESNLHVYHTPTQFLPTLRKEVMGYYTSQSNLNITFGDYIGETTVSCFTGFINGSRQNNSLMGIANEIGYSNYNNAKMFEVPFYSAANALVNGLDADELIPYGYAAHHFGYTILEFTFPGKDWKADLMQKFIGHVKIWKALGDESQLTMFQGFPPQALVLNHQSALTRAQIKRTTTRQTEQPQRTGLVEEETGGPSQGFHEKNKVYAPIDLVDYLKISEKQKRKLLTQLTNERRSELERHMFKAFGDACSIPGKLGNAIGAFEGVGHSLSDLLDYVQRFIPMMVQQFQISAANLGTMVFNCVTNLYTAIYSENTTIRILNLVSLLLNSRILNTNLMQKAIDLLTETYGFVRHSGGTEFYAKWAAIIVPAIFALFGISHSSRHQVDFGEALARTLRNSNTLSQFIKANLELITNTFKFISNKFFQTSYNISDASEEMKKWVEEAMEITAGHNDWSVLTNHSLKMRLCKLREQGQLFLTKTDPKMTALRQTLAMVQKSLNEVYDRVGMRAQSGELNREPVCVWLYGPRGIGKSFLNSDLALAFAKKNNIPARGGLMYTIPVGKYWNGYTGQPVGVFDDAGAVKTEESEQAFLTSWFGINTVAPYNVPMADIKDKDRIACFELLLANSNLMEYKSKNLSVREAFQRRIHYLLEFRLTKAFTEKYKMDRIPVDRAAFPGMDEDLKEGKHLEVKCHKDACKPNEEWWGTQEWMPYQEFKAWWLDHSSALAESLKKSAIARHDELLEYEKELELKPVTLADYLSGLANKVKHVGGDEPSTSGEPEEEFFECSPLMKSDDIDKILLTNVKRPKEGEPDLEQLLTNLELALGDHNSDTPLPSCVQMPKCCGGNCFHWYLHKWATLGDASILGVFPSEEGYEVHFGSATELVVAYDRCGEDCNYKTKEELVGLFHLVTRKIRQVSQLGNDEDLFPIPDCLKSNWQTLNERMQRILTKSLKLAEEVRVRVIPPICSAIGFMLKVLGHICGVIVGYQLVKGATGLAYRFIKGCFTSDEDDKSGAADSVLQGTKKYELIHPTTFKNLDDNGILDIKITYPMDNGDILVCKVKEVGKFGQEEIPKEFIPMILPLDSRNLSIAEYCKRRGISGRVVLVRLEDFEVVEDLEDHMYASADVKTKTSPRKPLRLPGRSRNVERQELNEPAKEKRYLNNFFQISLAGGIFHGLTLRGNEAVTVAHPYISLDHTSPAEIMRRQSMSLTVSVEDFNKFSTRQYLQIRLPKAKTMFALFIIVQEEGSDRTLYFKVSETLAAKDDDRIWNANERHERLFKLIPADLEACKEPWFRYRKHVNGRAGMCIDQRVSSLKVEIVGKYDLAVIQLPIEIAPCKDIIPGLISERTLGSLGDKYSILRFDFENESIRTVDLKYANYYTTVDKGKGDMPSFYAVGWEYDWTGACGLCGALLVNDQTGLIAGMHFAGTQNFGTSQVVNLELVEPYLGDTPIADDVDFPIDEGAESEFSKHMPPHFVPVGKLKHEYIPHLNTETAIKPTLANGKVELLNLRQPATLKNKGVYPSGYDVLAVGVKKQFDPSLPPKPTDMKLVVDNFKQHFINGLKPQRQPKQHFSYEEAILGIPGMEYFDALNLSTSAGFPYVNTKHAQNKRKIINVIGEGEDRKVFLDEDLAEELESSHQKLKRGIVPNLPYQDFLKDERLKFTNGKQKETRLVNGSATALAILKRMYFGEFLAASRRNRHDTGIMVGINIHGLEWTQLARNLLAKGSDICCGDYSAFGPTLIDAVIEAFGELANHWYTTFTGEEDEVSNRVRRTLLVLAIHSYHIAGDVVYQTHQGSPSGDITTADINSWVNKIYGALAWLDVFRGTVLSDLSYYHEFVYDAVYGDDKITAVSEQVIGKYNNVTLQEYFDRIGITYTDITKTGEMCMARNIEDSSFLKCMWIPHPTRPGLYLAALEKSVIEETALWCRQAKGVSKAEMSKEAAQTCISLAYSQGPRYMERIAGLLDEFYSSIGERLVIRSWVTLDTLAFDGKLFLDSGVSSGSNYERWSALVANATEVDAVEVCQSASCGPSTILSVNDLK